MTPLQETAFELFQHDACKESRRWLENMVDERLRQEGWRETRETAVFMVALSYALDNALRLREGEDNPCRLAVVIQALREYDVRCISLAELLKGKENHWIGVMKDRMDQWEEDEEE